MEDYKVAQEHNHLFHCSWLLVLMAFVTWKEQKHMQFLIVQGECRGVRYVNLWASSDPERQCINNQVFYTYYQ